MRILKNRIVLVVMAVSVGALGASCLTPAGSAGQDRTYFACAGIGGVIEPTSLRIDNQPVCEPGKTLQQWTQHADTSDLVGVTVELTGANAGQAICDPVSGICPPELQGLRATGTETELQCGADCSAISLRGMPYTLSTYYFASTQLTWTGCDNEPTFTDHGTIKASTCQMNGTHGAQIVADYSPVPAG